MTRAAKAVPPAIPSWFVARPGLEDRLDETFERRLTTVVAGPGFGKSTMLAAWASRVGAAWYTADAEDDALVTFAAGLLQALRPLLPNLPEGALGPAVAPRGPQTEERANAAALAALLSEVLEEQLTRDVVLVIDDFPGTVAAGGPTRLIEGLCRQAPGRLHLVISSRTDLAFPMERLRGQGQVLELDASILAMSESVVAELLAATFGDGAETLAGPLHRLTAGWPAALRLAIETLRNVPAEDRTAALEALHRPEGPLFQYLAEEVFGREPRPIRDFLRRVAPFDRFNAAMCDALGIPNPTRTLAALNRRGLFVQAQGGYEGWFTLHGLVREFLMESWGPDEEGLRQVRRLGAEWFEQQGFVEEALRSRMAAADHEAAARILLQRGAELLRRGEVEVVVQATEAMPASLSDERMEELAGEARQIRGDWDGALACFRRAAGDAETLPAGLAWRMGLIHYARGEPDESLRLYASGRIDGTEPRDEALLLAWSAAAHWFQGDLQSTRRLVTEAADRATSADDPQALAASHTVLAMLASAEGKQREAEEHSARALHFAERAGDTLQVIRILTNRASHRTDEARYEEALQDLDAAIPIAELTGFSFFLGLGLVNRAAVRFRMGRLDEAIADYEASRSMFERLGSRLAGYSLRGLGDVYLERGDLALARVAFEESLRLADEVADRQGLSQVLSGLARLLANEDPERAGALAERAVEGGSGPGFVDALLSMGWIGLARRDPGAAARKAEEAEEAARERRDLAGVAGALELKAAASPDRTGSGPLIEQALEIWRQLGSPLREARAEIALGRLSTHPATRATARRAERRLRAMGIRIAAAASVAGLLASLPVEEGPPVSIRSLGAFSVLREGRPVPGREWQSKKARDLLKILVARRGRPTPREVLAEALWPDEEPDRLGKRLAVQLSLVRSVLDPVDRYPPSHFIVTDADAIGLDLKNLQVDVELFLADAAAGLASMREGRVDEAREVLETAEVAYFGDFLEEDLYEDWAIPLREEAKSTYITVARLLARSARAGGDDEAAVRYSLRILERDPFDEDAHLGLISALVAAGRHGEARRTYRTYVGRMQELGVEPASFPGIRS